MYRGTLGYDRGSPCIYMRLERRVRYLYCIITLFVAGSFVFERLVFADEINGLQEIYDTPIPTEIRRNFDEYIHVREACPECEQGVLDGEEFVDIYTKKFIVIGFYPNSFGGVWAVIAVEDDALRAFRLWLYDINPNEYDLRSVTELTGSFDENAMQELCSSGYSHFWL